MCAGCCYCLVGSVYCWFLCRFIIDFYIVVDLRWVCCSSVLAVDRCFEWRGLICVLASTCTYTCTQLMQIVKMGICAGCCQCPMVRFEVDFFAGFVYVSFMLQQVLFVVSSLCYIFFIGFFCGQQFALNAQITCYVITKLIFRISRSLCSRQLWVLYVIDFIYCFSWIYTWLSEFCCWWWFLFSVSIYYFRYASTYELYGTLETFSLHIKVELESFILVYRIEYGISPLVNIVRFFCLQLACSFIVFFLFGTVLSSALFVKLSFGFCFSFSFLFFVVGRVLWSWVFFFFFWFSRYMCMFFGFILIEFCFF